MKLWNSLVTFFDKSNSLFRNEKHVQFEQVVTFLMYMNTLFKLSVDTMNDQFTMEFIHKTNAQDFMMFFSDLSITVCLEPKTKDYKLSVKLTDQTRRALVEIVWKLFNNVSMCMIDACTRHMYNEVKGKYMYVAFDPLLGDLFPSFTFLEKPNSPLSTTKVQGQIYYLKTQNQITLWMQSTIELLKSVKQNFQRRDRKEKCLEFNKVCKYEPLTSGDWCDVELKKLMGPDDQQRCWDITEILKHIENLLKTKTYGIPNPQIPSDPMNRVPFTMEELAGFWVKAGDINIRHKYPFLQKYITAIINQDIPANPIDGKWKDEEHKTLLLHLYGAPRSDYVDDEEV